MKIISVKKFRPALVLLNLLIVLTESEIIVSPDSEETVHTHCLSSGEDLVISNPFPSFYSIRTNPQKFFSLEWRFKKNTAQRWTPLITEIPDDPLEINEIRAKYFDGWGLRLTNITLEDSGTYCAELEKSSGGIKKDVTVTVAYPPTLNSTVLSVSKNSIKNGGSGTIFSCGIFGSFGQPAIYPKWRFKNGTTFNSTSQVGGDFFLEVPGPVDEELELECVLDFEAPAAHCIPESERNRWIAKWSPTETPGIENANNTILVVGIAVGVVVLIGIPVATLLIVKKRKQVKSIKKAEQEQLKRDEVEVPQEEEEDVKNQVQETEPSDGSSVEGFGTKVH